MKVVCPRDFSWVSPLGGPVAKGDVIDVDDDLAHQLVVQGWSFATTGKLTTKKAAPVADDKE